MTGDEFVWDGVCEECGEFGRVDGDGFCEDCVMIAARLDMVPWWDVGDDYPD